MGRPPTSVLVSYVKKQQQGRGIRKRKKVRRGRKKRFIKNNLNRKRIKRRNKSKK